MGSWVLLLLQVLSRRGMEVVVQNKGIVSIWLSHRSQQTISNPGVVDMEDPYQQHPRL